MADVQTRLDNIEEEVTCPVCAEIFTDPRNLPCLHSFCLRCLKEWYEKNRRTENPRYGTITCPTCRGVSSVPDSGDLNDLPISFYLNGLIDVLAVKESSNTEVTCGNCGEKSLEASYCFECSIFLLQWVCKCSQQNARHQKSSNAGTKRFSRKGLWRSIKATRILPETATSKRRIEILLQKLQSGSLPSV